MMCSEYFIMYLYYKTEFSLSGSSHSYLMAKIIYYVQQISKYNSKLFVVDCVVEVAVVCYL